MLALEAIEAGLDTPRRETPGALGDEAEEVVAAAENAGRVLAVGHMERFNPACLDLPRFVTEPLFIQTRRLSPYAERVHEGVVRDMMIHDVDSCCRLLARSRSASPRTSRPGVRNGGSRHRHRGVRDPVSSRS